MNEKQLNLKFLSKVEDKTPINFNKIEPSEDNEEVKAIFKEFLKEGMNKEEAEIRSLVQFQLTYSMDEIDLFTIQLLENLVYYLLNLGKVKFNESLSELTIHVGDRLFVEGKELCHVPQSGTAFGLFDFDELIKDIVNSN